MAPEKLRARLEQALPEKRLFLKSDEATRFFRLSTGLQLRLILGGGALMAWAVVATAVLLMDSIAVGNAREQALREQEMYSERLNELSAERDTSAEQARMAQERFYVALEEVSDMQSRLLASEDRRKELEKGIDVIQTTLRRTMKERDEARTQAAEVLAELEAETGSAKTTEGTIRELRQTVDFLTAALTDTAVTRDDLAEDKAQAVAEMAEMELDARLEAERAERIFTRLEDAARVSLEPLGQVFEQAGLPADRIIDEVRRSYTGQGGPLLPLSLSTRGEPASAEELRANEILGKLDEVNLHRMAVDQLPFAMPVLSSFRFTSGFGYRRDPKGAGTRMHNGTDFAASRGTPIYSTGDGVVVKAGWTGGYGRMITIKHAFGYETRYAHLSKIRVNVGDRVSRGDRIGDMGSTGRSTGTHLHYEVRQAGKAVNPMTFIKAGRNVF